MSDDTITRCGETHVCCQLHSWARDGFVKTFPAGFAVGGEFGEEVGQGGPEVFGDDGGLALLFGLEPVDFCEGLEGFGAPALDCESI